MRMFEVVMFNKVSTMHTDFPGLITELSDRMAVRVTISFHVYLAARQFLEGLGNQGHNLKNVLLHNTESGSWKRITVYPYYEGKVELVLTELTDEEVHNWDPRPLMNSTIHVQP